VLAAGGEEGEGGEECELSGAGSAVGGHGDLVRAVMWERVALAARSGSVRRVTQGSASAGVVPGGASRRATCRLFAGGVGAVPCGGGARAG
jgi:hypothetical protein